MTLLYMCLFCVFFRTLPTFLNKSKKKRKRVNSSDVSDLDLTPPGSPKPVVEDDPNAVSSLYRFEAES